MSAIDRQLLDLAELSLAKFGRLVDKTRQTIHSGIAKQEHYLKRRDLQALLEHARYYNSPRLFEIEQLISENYLSGGTDRDLILPHRKGMKLLMREAATADQTFIIYSDNDGHRVADRPFGKAVQALSRMKGSAINLVVPRRYELVKTHRDYRQEYQLPPGRSIVWDEASIPMVLFVRRESKAAFAFVQHTVEPIHPEDTELLWLKLSKLWVMTFAADAEPAPVAAE